MLSYLTLLILPNKKLNSFRKHIFTLFITLFCLSLTITSFASSDKSKTPVLSEQQTKSEHENSTEQQKSNSKNDTKLLITSDSMVVEKESSTITFSGNVIVKHVDFTIIADNISAILFSDKEKKANLSGNSPSNSQDIKSLTASGNVKLSSGNRTATGDQAIYTSLDQKITLTGESPRVTTGESYVTGKKIILFQNSGKVIIEGGKEKRVEALFNSQDDLKKESN